VTSDTVSGTASGTARARIARYGARHAHSQSSPTHRDHAPGPPTEEWSGEVSDDDDDDDDADSDGQHGQSSRMLVSFDGDTLRDTRV